MSPKVAQKAVTALFTQKVLRFTIAQKYYQIFWLLLRIQKFVTQNKSPNLVTLSPPT